MTNDMADAEFNTTFDIQGELDGITLDSPKAAPIPVANYVVKVNKVALKKFDPPKDTKADRGGSVIAVEYEIVTGDHKGRKIYTDYTWDVPTFVNEEGVRTILENTNTVAKHMADGMTEADAIAKSRAGIEQKRTIGRTGVKKLMNAVGFIDAKDMKPGDSNTKRIEAGTAVLYDASFELDMLVGRPIMASTKLGFEKTNKSGEKVQYLEVKNTWDVKPELVGDVPF